MVSHKGIVVSVEEEVVCVEIISHSACASCKAKSGCGMSESEVKTLFVETNGEFNVGDQVNVSVRQSVGLKAVFWLYLLPFIIVLITLLTFTELGVGDVVSGVASLAALALYYFIVYLLRSKIEREIEFGIEKI